MTTHDVTVNSSGILQSAAGTVRDVYVLAANAALIGTADEVVRDVYVTADNAALIQSTAAAPTIINELIANAVVLAGAVAAVRETQGNVSTSMTINGVVVSAAHYNVSAEALARIIDGIEFINDFWDGWAYNLNTGAPSFYEQFRFNSFLRVGNDYYGLNDDGLYLLGADDDAGEPINMTVTLGTTDFGADRTKKIPVIYAGAKSDRPMKLTARVDNEPDYTYEFTSAPGALSRCRVKLGRGLEGSYWQIELSNQDGADMELDSLDIPIDQNSRGI